jgi:GNAT superfamily N-acetyltransferase
MGFWNDEYPRELMYESIDEFEKYLTELKNPDHYLPVDKADEFVGWMSIFDRDDERWFLIILDKKVQRQGIGRYLLDIAKSNEKSLNGWVIEHDDYSKSSGQPYLSPINFYLEQGFSLTGEKLKDARISAVWIRWKSE